MMTIVIKRADDEQMIRKHLIIHNLLYLLHFHIFHHITGRQKGSWFLPLLLLRLL